MTSAYEGPPRVRASDAERDQVVTRVRASDAEREQVVTRLRAAIGEGRLTLVEGEERIASAYGSRFRDELPPLTGDLPADAPQRQGVEPAHRRGRVGPPPLAVLAGLLPLVVLGVFAALWFTTGVWPPVFPLVFFALILLRRPLWARYGRGWRYGGPWGPGWPDGGRPARESGRPDA